MQVSDSDLLKLQTKNMQRDTSVQGLSNALNDQIRQLAQQIAGILTYSRIDELPEEVLDILAWQFNVDWYDAASDVATKRGAIKNALILSRIRGTPAAIQRVLEIYFDDGHVKEWFDYGGQPYYFKAITTDRITTETKISKITESINKVKNLRSRLESITIQRDNNMGIYVAGVVSTLRIVTIHPAAQ